MKNKLKNRHKILSTLLSAVPNAIVICEVSAENRGGIVYCNDSFTRLTDYDNGEAVGRQISMLFGKSTDLSEAQKVIFAIHNGQYHEGELSVYKKDGTKLRCRFICSPVIDKNNMYVHSVIYIRDVSYKDELNYLSEAYSKQTDVLLQYKEAMDKSSIISKTDKFGTIIYANENFCKTSGYSAEELVGQSHNIVRHPDVPKETFRLMWQTILQKKVWQGIVQNRRKNGESYFVDATIMPILDQNGEITEFIAIRHDVTKEVLAKQEAQKALSQRTEFFAKASHELRTPLNIVINFAENLKEDLDEINKDEVITKEAANFIEKISKNAKYLLSLINDILDISKVENNRCQVGINTRENLQLLLSEVYESFKATMKQDVAYELDLETKPIFVRTNKRFLIQILLNLLSNSAKFTAEGMIRIVLVREGKFAIIKVIDTGRGIAKEKMDIIFEPFIQANRNDEGTGLGLKLVKELCLALNIDLKVESEVGVGTTFIMQMEVEND